MRSVVFAPRTLASGAVLAAMLVTPAAQGRDPRTGTWRLNTQKSIYKPGPPPRSVTVRIEPSGQGEHVRSEAVDATGTRTVTEYVAAYDGTDYPLKGSPLANTVLLKRVDAYTTERFDKKDGHVMLVYRRVVSPDGRLMTVTINGVDVRGRQVSNTLIFEKQTAK